MLQRIDSSEHPCAGPGRGAPAPSTLVCNAANANDGYATRLVTVPTVIDLVDDEEPCENLCSS